MLLGKENLINQKLIFEINKLIKLKFIDLDTFKMYPILKPEYSPRIILVNLIDVGSFQIELLSKLKTIYPDVKIIGIHNFISPNKIKLVLENGFDAYMSVFNLGEELVSVFESLSFRFNNKDPLYKK
jgi:hypothetical protein